MSPCFDISAQVLSLPRVKNVVAFLRVHVHPSMITVLVNIQFPQWLDLNDCNLPVKWHRFCRAWSNYEIATQLKDPEYPDRNKERHGATLLTCIGSDALDIIDAMKFENEDQRKN